jgi:GNAT superfamily N-acetyltransferase
VRIAAIPTPHWCDGFAAANQVPGARRAIHDRMLQAIRFPAAFATIERDGAPLGLGLAVAERGMVGLFDIVTAPHARRQGVARRLVEALLAWGRTERATGAYLQVVATNLPAITLYRSMGFAEAYRYHYRIASGS